jgi:hypothetical protein
VLPVNATIGYEDLAYLCQNGKRREIRPEDLAEAVKQPVEGGSSTETEDPKQIEPTPTRAAEASL